MKKYEINSATIAILPIDENNCEVIEDDNKYIVSRSTTRVIDDSCRYFGSSYLGRFEGSKELLGGTVYKSPIIVDGSRTIIFFPTGSARCYTCAWIALNKIATYQKSDNQTFITFKNGETMLYSMSYASFENQVLRSSRLESILRQRKSN